MRPRTPAEKKRLSLEKDRRNVYGEAPHGARKNIPLRKKLRNRANRHLQESQLPSVPVEMDLDEAEQIQSAMFAKAPVVWDKTPDAPLKEVLARKQWKRSTPKADRVTVYILGS
jgi:hypothetical protein